MNQLLELIEKIKQIAALDILIAIGIILFFRIFSSGLSYIIIKMFKFKTKNPVKIKENAFYKPLKIFFIIFGFYLGILFLKQPLKINDQIMTIITKLFGIIITFAFAKGLAGSFRNDSTAVKKLKKKLNLKVEDATFEFILKIVRGLIYLVAIFIVMSLLNIDLSALVAGLGVSGIIITLAAQDTAKNLFGGLVIFFDKPFNVGDWIKMDLYEGTVEDITFRSTRIRTTENSIVNIPNSIISNTSITNGSKMEKRRYLTNICISFNTPKMKLEEFQKRVEFMLIENEIIIKDTILVKFDTINANGINILISAYMDTTEYNKFLEEKEKINYKIMDLINEMNLEIAYDTKMLVIQK